MFIHMNEPCCSTFKFQRALMKRICFVFLISLFAAVLMACGELKLDTSSENAFLQSRAKIYRKLPPRQNTCFERALDILMDLYGTYDRKKGAAWDEKNTHLNKLLNGKTAEEVIDLSIMALVKSQGDRMSMETVNIINELKSY